MGYLVKMRLNSRIFSKVHASLSYYVFNKSMLLLFLESAVIVILLGRIVLCVFFFFFLLVCVCEREREFRQKNKGERICCKDEVHLIIRFQLALKRVPSFICLICKQLVIPQV